MTSWQLCSPPAPAAACLLPLAQQALALQLRFFPFFAWRRAATSENPPLLRCCTGSSHVGAPPAAAGPSRLAASNRLMRFRPGWSRFCFGGFQHLVHCHQQSGHLSRHHRHLLSFSHLSLHTPHHTLTPTWVCTPPRPYCRPSLSRFVYGAPVSHPLCPVCAPQDGPCAAAAVTTGVSQSSQVKSSQVKSSQVKSSQVLGMPASQQARQPQGALHSTGAITAVPPLLLHARARPAGSSAPLPNCLCAELDAS